ncbi:MAG TPA: hypothetical protein VMI13_05235 [Solirubrobacteraceae bacterium]|nr:hypothetical protein [Solirubrobacteraceae bacterium]
MESEHQPLDPILAAALVTRTIEDIDQSTEEESESLLSALVCAAWGNLCSLSQ